MQYIIQKAAVVKELDRRHGFKPQ